MPKLIPITAETAADAIPITLNFIGNHNAGKYLGF
jgi:hypothetical protein